MLKKKRIPKGLYSLHEKDCSRIALKLTFVQCFTLRTFMTEAVLSLLNCLDFKTTVLKQFSLFSYNFILLLTVSIKPKKWITAILKKKKISLIKERSNLKH